MSRISAKRSFGLIALGLVPIATFPLVVYTKTAWAADVPDGIAFFLCGYIAFPGALLMSLALWRGYAGSGGVVIALLSISWRVVGLIGTAFFFYFVKPPLYIPALRFYLVCALIFLFFEVATVVVQKILATTLWRRTDASSSTF